MFKRRFHLYDLLVLGSITLFIVLIYFTNFAGHFWLTGWDNLHPELNYQANLGRAFFSAWQEYQGLGLPAGHGHATELSRELLLSLLNLFTPASAIRKIFSLLMLWTGVVGVYVFLRNILLTKINFELRVIVSFIASIFYLFNLATLQIFYVPYEAFMAMYAFLPWMVYALYNYMQSPSKKSLLLFLVINFLGTWQFYIPTLFIVYMILIGVIGLGIVIEHKVSWKHFLIALAGILIVNLYWLLPFTYYTLNNISSQQDAYLNLLYTEDTYLKTIEFGGLKDAVILKSFLFDTVQFATNTGFQYMMGSWIAHSEKWYVLFIGYSFFMLVVIGLVYALRKRTYLYLCGLFIVFFAFLANQTFPFNLINNFFHSLPLVDQVFRNPFTKFANTILFLMTIFLSIGLVLLITTIQKQWEKFFAKKYLYLTVLYLFLVAINIYIAPLWQGNFIYPELKKTIPQEYFQLFDYFKQQKNGRIANLPQFTPNGWDYYQWGYQGSGFLWYGIRQPILDRAFDVWSKDNENYYWEISEAIYSQNTALFETLLEKYQISWLVLDGNVTTTASAKILFSDELETMLQNSKKVVSVKQFGKIKIYEVKLQTKPSNYAYLSTSLPTILPSYEWNNRDQGFIDYGNYKSVEKLSAKEATIFYPFRSLFTGRRQDDLAFYLREDANYFIFRQQIPEAFKNAEIITPTLDNNQIIEIDKNDFTKTITKRPIVAKNGNFFEVYVPKVNGYFSNTTIVSAKLAELKPNNCNKFNQGSLALTSLAGKETLLQLQSIHSNNCLDFALPNLAQRLPYLLSIQTKHFKGKSLYLTVNNNTTDREELATYLPKNSNLTTSYFVLPPRQEYGIGYSVHLDNISLDQTATINELGEIRINPIPYEFLTGIKLVKNEEKISSSEAKSAIKPAVVIYHNPSWYTIKANGLENMTDVVLTQAYNHGWHAYMVDNWWGRTFPMLFGKELKEHVLVNNWENGWSLTESRGQRAEDRNGGVEIVITFLPQWLEYFGFILLPLPFIFLLIRGGKD